MQIAAAAGTVDEMRDLGAKPRAVIEKCDAKA